MRRFVLTAAAEQDLFDLWDYLAQDDFDAADRVTNEISRAIERLVEMPGMGHVRNDLADELIRFWPVRSYLIIYRPESAPLEILRIVSGYRDVAALLDQVE
jgi:plasmid stabilization system protein ParE